MVSAPMGRIRQHHGAPQIERARRPSASTQAKPIVAPRRLAIRQNAACRRAAGVGLPACAMIRSACDTVQGKAHHDRTRRIWSTRSPATAACGATARPTGRAGWCSENRLTVDDLIWPIFIVPGTGIVDPIAAMPGVNRMSIDKAVEAAKEAADLGIPAIATFPNIEMWPA